MYLEGQQGDFVGEMDLSEAEDCGSDSIEGTFTGEMSEEDKNLREVSKLVVEQSKEEQLEGLDEVDRDTREYIKALYSEGKDVDEIYEEIESMVVLGVMGNIVEKDIISDIVKE